MTASSATTRPVVEWGFASRPLEGDCSGDLHVVAHFDRGALLAVLDGLGHGEEAGQAAAAGMAVLQADPSAPVQDLILRCHEAMRGTRGAVMTVVSIDAVRSELDWCGVGNVEAVLVRGQPGLPSEAVPTRGGVVGYRLPPLKVSSVPITPGDVLVLASDGLRSGFGSAILRDEQPQQIASALFARYAKTTDDALVLAARYLGAYHE
jgi:phosphoserine phosphatase RsbX